MKYLFYDSILNLYNDIIFILEVFFKLLQR